MQFCTRKACHGRNPAGELVAAWELFTQTYVAVALWFRLLADAPSAADKLLREFGSVQYAKVLVYSMG